VTAASNVMQLVRAHFLRDEIAFASAATALARSAKSPAMRMHITETLKRGYARRPGEPPLHGMQPAHAPRPANISNLLHALPEVGFAELLLEPALQLCLDEIVTEIEYRDDLLARKLRPRSRLLFHGPPGNGKSSSGAALAKALGMHAYGVSLPRVIDKYVGATGQHLGELFDSLRPGMVVVFDELDAVGAHRGSADQAASKEFNGIVNTLLTLMDRNRDGVLIATTNRIDIIDPALLRRFDEHVEFPAPTSQQMASLAAKLCAEHGVEPVDVADCRNFDEVTKRVQREARRIVMREILLADEAGDDDETENEDSAAAN
jgi:SpoVK/Ycf46/Vps4 family AAA+-type ATPase